MPSFIHMDRGTLIQPVIHCDFCREYVVPGLRHKRSEWSFADGKREGTAIRGVEPEFILDEGTTRYLDLEAGSLELERQNDALVGSAIAAKLGLNPGDILNLITVRTEPGWGASARNHHPSGCRHCFRRVSRTGFTVDFHQE
jgi:hypothetical protein